MLNDGDLDDAQEVFLLIHSDYCMLARIIVRF